MAAPQYRSAGTFQSGNGSAITPGLPTGWQAGDLFLMFVEADGAGVTAPAGWAELQDDTDLGVILYKVAGAGEAAPSINKGSADHMAAQIIAISGADPGDPFSGLHYGSSSGSAFSIGHTGAEYDNSLVVDAVFWGTDTGTSQASGWSNETLTGLVERVDSSTVSGNGGGFAIATGVLLSAGTPDATSGSLASSAFHVGHSIIVNPVPGVEATGSGAVSAIQASGQGALALSAMASTAFGAIALTAASKLVLSGSVSAGIGPVACLASAALALGAASTVALGPIVPASGGAVSIDGSGSASLGEVIAAGFLWPYDPANVGGAITSSGSGELAIDGLAESLVGEVGVEGTAVAPLRAVAALELGPIAPAAGAGLAVTAFAQAGFGGLAGLSTATLALTASGAATADPVTGIGRIGSTLPAQGGHARSIRFPSRRLAERTASFPPIRAAERAIPFD